MKNNNARIRAATLIIILVIISLLLLRFIAQISLSSNQPSVLGSILLLPTNPIGALFESIKIGSIEVSSIVAIIFFIIVSYLSSKIITSLESEKSDERSLELLEAFLRTFEFLIILRVALEFMGATSTNSPFVAILFFLTGWTSFIIKPLSIGFGIMDISALIMLGIIVALDINTEIILRALKFIQAGSSKSVEFLSNSAKKALKTSDESNTPITEAEAATTPLPLDTPVLKPDVLVQPQPEVSENKPIVEAAAAPVQGKTEPETSNQTIVINLPKSEDSSTSTPAVVDISKDQIKITQSGSQSESSITKGKEQKTKHKDDITAPEG